MSWIYYGVGFAACIFTGISICLHRCCPSCFGPICPDLKRIKNIKDTLQEEGQAKEQRAADLLYRLVNEGYDQAAVIQAINDNPGADETRLRRLLNANDPGEENLPPVVNQPDAYYDPRIAVQATPVPPVATAVVAQPIQTHSTLDDLPLPPSHKPPSQIPDEQQEQQPLQNTTGPAQRQEDTVSGAAGRHFGRLFGHDEDISAQRAEVSLFPLCRVAFRP